MYGILQDFFSYIGISLEAPSTLAELLPWYISILFTFGLIGSLFKFISMAIREIGRSSI